VHLLVYELTARLRTARIRVKLHIFQIPLKHLTFDNTTNTLIRFTPF